MEIISILWTEVIMRPMLNGLVLLSSSLFGIFGLSIIIFTILIRLLTLPLTLKYLRQTRAMSALQPRIKAIQEKHGKDRQKVSQETMRLYKEAGVNPIGCLGPMFIQFPIWIGLYMSIIKILPTTPEALANLADDLYSGLPFVHEVLPLNSHFLGFDLALQDSSGKGLFLAILVGASMWVQQKMMTMPTTDPKQASQAKMMLWMMPIMFGFITLQVPSGLALYWLVSNLIGIPIQYFVTGWGSLLSRGQAGTPVPVPAAISPAKETISDGNDRHSGSDREDRGRGHRARDKAARRRARGGGGRHR